MGSFKHWAAKPSQLFGNWSAPQSPKLMTGEQIASKIIVVNAYWFMKHMWVSHLRPSIEDFTTHLPRHVQRMLRESSKGMYSKKRMSDGRQQVTGGKRLKESGKYTPAFGKFVAKLLLKQKANRVPCF